MIDSDGYRANVGVILCDDRKRVLWARRVGQNAWQFPQGGIQPDESAEEALYRELYEEIGLGPDQVTIVGRTKRWLRYKLPDKFIRRGTEPLCLGQKQKWYILRLLGSELDVKLDTSAKPEFDRWRWVDYWLPSREVIFFKRQVYRKALKELAPLVFERAEQPRRAKIRHYTCR